MKIREIEVVSPRKTTAHQRKLNAERQARFREKQKQKQTPEILLEEKWEANFNHLSDPEAAELLRLHDTQTRLSQAMARCIENIRSGVVDRDLQPDSVYSEVKQFIEESGGLVHSFTPMAFDFAEAVNADDWDDPRFKLYGLRTQIVSMFYRYFVEHVTKQATQNEPVTAPAQLSGLPPLSEAAEKALIAKQQNEAIRSEIQALNRKEIT